MKRFMFGFFISLCFVFSYLDAAPMNIPEDVTIQDTEIETFLTDLLKICFKAEDLRLNPKVYVINSRTFNAMATYGGVVMVTTATLMECDNLMQLFGILLHETGHIKGGHLARIDVAADRASLPSMIAMGLGGIASLATGNPGPFMMGALGANQVFDRSMKKHSRDEETNADMAAAKILGQDSKYLAEILRKLERKNSSSDTDPYTSTHPLTPERISAAQSYADLGEAPKVHLSPEMFERFAWIQNKVRAYLLPRDQINIAYKSPQSGAERYGAAIGAYRSGNARKAQQDLDALIDQYPNNPYLIELKAQICFEQGNMRQTLKWAQKAHKMLPNSIGTNTMLALAILDGEKYTTLKNPAKKAIELLTRALDDKTNPFVWHLLARAYGKAGDMNSAMACHANASFLRGDFKAALVQVKKGMNSRNRILAQQSSDLEGAIKSAQENEKKSNDF